MTTVEQINKLIAELSEEERNNVSDGYHTFGELYEHRCRLYVAMCNMDQDTNWHFFRKSKVHFDGTSWDGWFILQADIGGKQISYHLPMKLRDHCKCEAVAIADERDGHTSQDVLDRLLLV